MIDRDAFENVKFQLALLKGNPIVDGDTPAGAGAKLAELAELNIQIIELLLETKS